MIDTFKALVLTQDQGKTEHHIRQLSADDLPDGDILVAVNLPLQLQRLPGGLLDHVYKVISLGDVSLYVEKLLAGRVKGRVVVDVTL